MESLFRTALIQACWFFLIAVVTQDSQALPLSSEAAINEDHSQTPRQGSWFGDVLSTVSGIFGFPSASTSTDSEQQNDEASKAFFENVDLNNPLHKPGTTNSGGIANQVIAAVSGAGVGVMKILGIGQGTDDSRPLSFIFYTTAAPFGHAPVVPAESSLKIPSIPSEGNHLIPANGVVRDFVNGVFGASSSNKANCSDLSKLLGQC